MFGPPPLSTLTVKVTHAVPHIPGGGNETLLGKLGRNVWNAKTWNDSTGKEERKEKKSAVAVKVRDQDMQSYYGLEERNAISLPTFYLG